MDYQAWCPLLWGAPVQRSQYVCGIEGSQWDSRSATEYSVPDWTALIHSKWCSWALAEVGLFIRHTLVQSMLLSSVAHGTVIYLGWDCVHRKGQGMPSRCIHRSSPDSVGLWVRRQSARVSPRNHTPQRVIDVQTLPWQQRIASRTDAGASPRHARPWPFVFQCMCCARVWARCRSYANNIRGVGKAFEPVRLSGVLRQRQHLCSECIFMDSATILSRPSFQHKYIIKAIHRLCNKPIITFS